MRDHPIADVGTEAALKSKGIAPSVAGSPPTLVVGLGNPILGDDGVGWRVADRVRKEIRARRIPAEVDCLAVGGLALMERLIGYERAILVDAITTGMDPPGSVRRLRLEDLQEFGGCHLGSAHDTSLQTALRVGAALGASLPKQLWIVSVEIERNFDFGGELTPRVEAAVAGATELVLEALLAGTGKE